MKKQINYYNFNKISSNMSKKFGVIQKGDEGSYSNLLSPMESNLLKTSRLTYNSSGRTIIAAIHICLLKIDGYLNNIEYDLTKYETEETVSFVQALLMSFDPFSNGELNKIVKDEYDLNSPDELRQYFKEIVMCLVRIEKSVELWSKESGDKGYIYFLEQQIGRAIKHDDKMDYSYALRNVK